MQQPNNRYTRGVNEAGRALTDDEVKVRFQQRNQSPWVLMFTKVLNAFGAIVSPIKKEDRMR